MAASRRSAGRNVHIYLETKQEPIGGLRLDPSTLHITTTNFYRLLQILVLPTIPIEMVGIINSDVFQVFDCATNTVVVADLNLLHPGSYVVRATHPESQSYTFAI